MSTSRDDSLLDADDLDPSKKIPDEPWNDNNDSLLTEAFEEQMKLVEKSIRDSGNLESAEQPKKNRHKKNKKTQQQQIFEPASSSTNKHLPQQKSSEKKAKQQPQQQKQPTTDDTQKQNDSKTVFSNRSCIYRYDGGDKAPELDHAIFAPPTIDCSTIHEATDDKQARQKMLMSWYVAGYNTGYYEAMKKYKKSSDD